MAHRLLAASRALTLLAALPGVLAAQRAPAPPDMGWSVRPNSAVDLWFHGMALTGLYDDSLPLPLYNSEYVAVVRQAKQERGVVTLLDSAGPQLRREFGRLRVPDALHFLPLHFHPAPAPRMLAALRAVADRRALDSALARSDVRLGAAAAAVQLQRTDERRWLRRFVDALQSEWDRFYEAYWDETLRAHTDRYNDIRQLWRTRLGPALAPFLRRARLEGGVIAPSPALGLEGRLDAGDALDGRDNLVAVWLPPAAHGADLATFAVLKELCFVVVNDVVPRTGGAERDLEAVRARAAVRCGALLLEFYAPTLVARYRRMFLTAAGQADATSAVRAFEALYPLDPTLYQALREAIRRR